MTRHPRPAILDRIPLNGHAVIEASAGTGKTFTLEHLVVELLLRGGVDIEQILVVTFTERATGELRARVRAKLESLLGEPAAPPTGSAWEIGEAERDRVTRALGALDAATLSTIHAFCRRVLGEHAFASGRLFGETLVNGEELFDRAFGDALRTTLGRAPHLQG
jgi:exodeoxyribonuclease V beta subunit